MKIMAIAVGLMMLAPAVAAQSQTPAPKPGPEYRAYDVWIGDWQYEGTSMASPLGPAGSSSGKQTVRWVLNGFFVEFRSEEKGPLGDAEVIELDWYDAATKTYPFQSYSNNGDILTATGTVSGNVWKNSGTLTHSGVKYHFRNVITMAADGMSATWRGEISPDGKTWQPLNEGKATKIKK
jgi:hypothetical protein